MQLYMRQDHNNGMQRKLIQHGLSSLTISLPQKWIKGHNLKKGEEVGVTESKGRLVVSAETNHEHKRISIDITNAEPMIRRIVGATYKAGYDEVEIKFSSYEELKTIQELMREQFTGFEIMNQTKNQITIKDVAQPSVEEFNNVLRRFFFVLHQIASEVSSAAEKNDKEWLKSTTLLKIESDRCADFCRRAINTGFDSTFKRHAPLYTVIEQMEKVIDRYVELSKYIITENIEPNNDLRELLKELNKFQEMFVQVFYKFELQKMIEFGKTRQSILDKVEASIQNCTKKEIKGLVLVDRILSLIFNTNGALMAIYI